MSIVHPGTRARRSRSAGAAAAAGIPPSDVWEMFRSVTREAQQDMLMDADASSTTVENFKRIVKTPNTCAGAWRVSGTRMPLRVLKDYREFGMSNEEILENFPFLSAEDLAAAWAFIADNPESVSE